MAPRNNTRHGASTSARGTAKGRTSSGARSARTSKPRTTPRATPRSSSTATRATGKKQPRTRTAPVSGKRSVRGSREHSMTAFSAPVVVVLAIAAIAWSFYPVMRIQYREEQNRAALQAELETLQQRNERLRAQVDRLKTPEGVEELARENLGMVKQGENLYVVMDGTEATPTVDVDSDVPPDVERSTWQKILDVLFDVDR